MWLRFIACRLAHQRLGIQRTRSETIADGLVHDRLGSGGFVGLAVTVASIAHHVDHHILVEVHTIIQRHACDLDHCLGIIAIDVKDRRIDHLGDVGAVQRGTRVTLVAGGKTDLVVYDDVHRTLGGEPTRLRHVDGFHHHALTGESRIAVNQDGYHPVAGLIAAALLTRAHRAFHHRVNDLQVRRVERQRNVHQPFFGFEVGGKSLVVLHITRTVGSLARRTFEFLEQLSRSLADNIDEHIETTAVRHADNHFPDTDAAATVDQFIQQRDQAVTAFQREALLSHVACVQVALEAFRCGQALQDTQAFCVAELHSPAGVLQALLYPALLGGLGNVHVFTADAFTVHRV